MTNYLENIIFSEKIIVGPQEGEIPPPLAQMVLTQCTSISELLQYVLFSPPFESPTKNMTQKYGSTVKNLSLTFGSKIFS